MSVLVTGGSGYIGTFLLSRLKERKKAISLDLLPPPVVFDGVVYLKGDYGDGRLLDELFERFSVEGVVHLGGYVSVAESQAFPTKYYQNNFCKSLVLMERVRRTGGWMVFSSSAAVYSPSSSPLVETSPLAPASVYGKTKVWCETAARDLRLRGVALRFFNVAGGEGDDFGEFHVPETHLLPKVLIKALRGEEVEVYGNDYPTKDGSAVRDFVHVLDLVDGILRAIKRAQETANWEVFNLGTGRGYSVFEVIAAVERVLGKKLKVVVSPRREGDPPVLVADSRKAQKILGWRVRRGLEETVESQLPWVKKRLNDFVLSR